MKTASPRLRILLLLFVGSGCAALIYEIVWFQLLQLVIGSSAVSLGVLLGTFMGGMCLGSLLLSRVIAASRHPVRVFGILEIGIGTLGILVLAAVPLVGGVYTTFAGPGYGGILLRAAICALCLLPPTVLMGATLPAISRWVETTREGVSWLGFFYGGNLAGAVLGCVLAGFYLLRVHSMLAATVIAVMINAAVGLAALLLSARTPYKVTHQMDYVPDHDPARQHLPVYLAIALSGLSALGAEVIWTRQLSLVFGPTVYTFSIILAVFLMGLGIGSSAGSAMARRYRHPALALGLCQLLLTTAILWAAWAIVYSLPFWPIDPVAGPWKAFRLDVIRSMWAILPAACLWGASFPLALAAIAGRNEDPGRLTGTVYASNTFGAIAGALGFSVLMIPAIGSQSSQRVLIAVCAVSAIIMFSLHFRRLSTRLAPVGAALGLAIVLGWLVPEVPGLLVAYGRNTAMWANTPPEVLYVGEGVNSSVAVTEWPNGMRQFHVAGKVEASTANTDMRLQRMLGHLSALAHPNPRSVLIVGFGAGVTAGSFVLYPGIERIVICEIEPLIPDQVASYFAPQNYDVLHDPRVEVVYDDARHYILTTEEKFDIITSDPIHPWVKGAATLYTTEYFEKVKEHLNPGGVISQWVPLYDSTEEVVKSELATFFQTFPDGAVYGNDIGGRGYDVVLVARDGELPWAGLQVNERVAGSLHDVGFRSPAALVDTYTVSGADLRNWLLDAQINTDRTLRLQYLAGMVVDYTDADSIYQTLLRYRSR